MFSLDCRKWNFTIRWSTVHPSVRPSMCVRDSPVLMCFKISTWWEKLLILILVNTLEVIKNIKFWILCIRINILCSGGFEVNVDFQLNISFRANLRKKTFVENSYFLLYFCGYKYVFIVKVQFGRNIHNLIGWTKNRN